jgi:hypothetical protein
MQVANLLEDENRLNEAYKYVKITSETYNREYGQSSDNTILADWLMLQISYSLNNHSGNQVIEMADNLFKALVQRDANVGDRF